jgi:hypothetical protein
MKYWYHLEADMTNKEVCATCGSDNILQRVTFMTNPNAPRHVMLEDNWEWDDFYYCEDCEDTCDPKEVEV